MVAVCEFIHEGPEFFEVIFIKAARCRAVPVAQEGDRDAVLGAIPHEFRRRTCDMRDADMLPRRQKIVVAGREQAPEQNPVSLPVPRVEDPVLETEVVSRLLILPPGAVNAERSVIGDNRVGESRVIADVVLGQDIVALVAAEFTLGGDISHPFKLEVGVGDRIKALNVRECTVERAHKVVADALAPKS